MKYLKELRARFKDSVAFTISDLRIFLKNKRISTGYLHLLIHNLLTKGEIKRITRGVFTFRDEIQTVGFGFSPFYYGLQEALSLRNIWEQETNPVVITPRHVRVGLRSFGGRNYLVRRISRRMFFGFEMLRYYDFWIPVSDVEKTLIDFAYFREPLGAGALREIKVRLRKEVLSEYLKRCPKLVAKRVLELLRKS